MGKPSPTKKASVSDDDSDFGAPKKAGNGFKASDSDSDFIKDSPPPKAKKEVKKEPKKAPKKKLQNFGGDSDDEDGFGAKPAKKAKKSRRTQTQGTSKGQGSS